MTGLTALIVACGIVRQVAVLEAIVRVESGGNPIALSVNGAVELVRAPRDRSDAAAMARWLAGHGYNFDAGLAQVNSANFARLGLDTSSVFEPCRNLQAAATVLDECGERARASGLVGAPAWAATLSCYNTGDLSRGIRNGYAAAARAAASSGRAMREASRSAQRSFPNASRRPDVFTVASPEPFAACRSEERVPRTAPPLQILSPHAARRLR